MPAKKTPLLSARPASSAPVVLRNRAVHRLSQQLRPHVVDDEDADRDVVQSSAGAAAPLRHLSQQGQRAVQVDPLRERVRLGDVQLPSHHSVVQAPPEPRGQASLRWLEANFPAVRWMHQRQQRVEGGGGGGGLRFF